MISMLLIVGFSLLVGVIAAGLVWYGWALAENGRVVMAAVRVNRAAAKAAKAAEEAAGGS